MQSLLKRQVHRTLPVPFGGRRCPNKVCRSTNGTQNGVATKAIIDEVDTAKLQELERRFKMADSDGNGSIDRNELRIVLESTDGGDAVMFTEHWLPDEELDLIMDKYDKDKNGVIDFEEFKQIVYDGLLLDGKLSEYEAAFNAVDSSGNGTIGATELAQLFSMLGNPVSFEKLVDIMQEYDKDESGQIEFNEFLLMFRDQLIDLKAVQEYMGATKGAARQSTDKVLDAPEGDIALIFSEKEFDEALEGAAASGKLLVLFSALTWCRPCKGLQRPAQKMADAYKDTTVWIKLFGNANEQTKNMFKNRFQIRSTPSLIVFKGKEIVYTQTGTSKEKLENGIRAALAGNSKLPAEMLYPPVEAPPA
eukprot:CAMPEP_0202867274 /NCGR_PEP_ID=MMETSP1391-20130828/9073_1 /ASSEMBLY_ACC=CAM_ASM_000867 /TAXON_ID=1034604 /ORGANISM="Chlamydomonas leiostraca, Strain SAG 11-49" /LENGTH=362 /DNA_ID=CAMNT_0049547303 /DNA_START=21 /DNA_END=1109 /DNA_ORIENTATION=+